jgi:hypothetical protein
LNIDQIRFLSGHDLFHVLLLQDTSLGSSLPIFGVAPTGAAD